MVFDVKRFILTFLLLVAVSSGVMALSISAPSEIPANTAWSFYVELNPTDSFSSAELLIDDAEILTVYSNGSIVENPYKGGFVLKAFVIDTSPSSTSGLNAHISHMGLGSGSHTIVVRENTGEETSSTVQAVSVADVSGIESRLNEAIADKEEIDFQIQSILADSRAFNEMIKSNEEGIGNLQSQINQIEEIRSSINSLEASLQQQGDLSEETKSGLQQLRNEFDNLTSFLQEKEIASLGEEDVKGEELLPVSGLVGLGMGILSKIWLPVILLFGFIAIVLVVFYVKKFLSREGDSPYFEADTEEVSFEDEGIPPEKEAESEKKGRWAAE